MYQCLLACGCQVSANLESFKFPVSLACPTHTRADAFQIIAIECREYKLACMDCRYGKWCGSNHLDALFHTNRHVTSKPGHRVYETYAVHRDIKDKFRRIYGRKIKLWIEGIYVPNMKKTSAPIEKVELPDEPSF